MLTFNLKKQWFDKIKSGEKTHEYREVKPYWTKRLTKIRLWMFENSNRIWGNDPERKIKFCCGYPEKIDLSKRVFAYVKSIKIINGKNTDLAVDKDVYDIEFELIKGGEQW